MSSSLFPLNMLPQMTSMRPRPLVLSTCVPPIRKKEEGRKKRGKQYSPLPFSFFLFAFRLDFEPVFLGELLNATFGIDELPLPREEWMATGTDLDADVLLRGPGHKGGAAGATNDGGLVVLGMDALFHELRPLSRQREQGNAKLHRPSVSVWFPLGNHPRLYHTARGEETRSPGRESIIIGG